MSKVVLRGQIEVSDTDIEAVIEELPNHIYLTRAEQGCIVFEVVRDQTFTNRFSVYEEFSSKHAFEEHQVRVRSSRWGAVTVNAIRNYEMSYEDE